MRKLVSVLTVAAVGVMVAVAGLGCSKAEQESAGLTLPPTYEAAVLEQYGTANNEGYAAMKEE